MPLQLTPDKIGFNDRSEVFKLPFEEQIAFFRGKLNLPTEHYDDILKAAHDRAFVVAGAQKADLLTDFHAAVEKAIAEGKSIQWFRQQFDDIVAKNGWAYTGSRDWRTRIIYTTNSATSYAAGRWAQLNDPDLLKARPYWRYVHNDTVAHPRPLHVEWSGLTLRHDDPWWQTHYPPNGWGCRCRAVAVSKPNPNRDTAPDDGTYEKVDRNGEIHTIPKGVDYGWDYAPGASKWQPDLTKYPAPIREALQSELRRGYNPAMRDFRQPKGDFTIYDAAVPKTIADTSTPLKAAVIQFEDEIRGSGLEVGAFFASDGKLVLRREGDADRIGIRTNEFAAVEGTVFTHVHPQGGNFSPDDLERAFELKLAELRVVTRMFRFSVASSAERYSWPGGKALGRLIAKHQPGAIAEVKDRIISGELNPRDAQAEVEHVLWRRIFEAVKLTYRREKL
jgi:hypothetical protein